MDESPAMVEVRIDVHPDDLVVLDAYVQSDVKRSRASVIRGLIREFADKQIHTATMVCRAKRINPLSTERRRNGEGA